MALNHGDNKIEKSGLTSTLLRMWVHITNKRRLWEEQTCGNSGTPYWTWICQSGAQGKDLSRLDQLGNHQHVDGMSIFSNIRTFSDFWDFFFL